MNLEAFELVLLRQPVVVPSLDEETLERIQREHLEFHRHMRDTERVATNGPVLNQPDESLRGLTFYRTGTIEDATKLARSDPAVVSGRLSIEVMTWWCPPGTMVRTGAPVSVNS